MRPKYDFIVAGKSFDWTPVDREKVGAQRRLLIDGLKTVSSSRLLVTRSQTFGFLQTDDWICSHVLRRALMSSNFSDVLLNILQKQS